MANDKRFVVKNGLAATSVNLVDDIQNPVDELLLSLSENGELIIGGSTDIWGDLTVNGSITFTGTLTGNVDADFLAGANASFYLDYGNFANTPDSILDFGVIEGTDGQYLQTNGNGVFTFADVTASTVAMNDITDVTITGPVADNELLAYNTATSQWINQTPTEAGFANVAITGSYSDLSDTPANVSFFTNDAGYLTANDTIDADTLEGANGSFYLDFGNFANLPDPVLTLSGDATGNATFTDLGSATLTVAVVDDSHNHTVSTITDFSTAVNTAITNTVNTAFVDALNVDAATLEGSNGAYYLDFTNFANLPDPVLTLSGDATGNATFTDLGNATLTVAVVDDSHNHTVSTITDFGTAVNTAINTTVNTAFVDALNVDAATLEGSNGAFYLDFGNFANLPDPVLALSGDATGNTTFTDLGNATLTVAIVDDSHNHTVSTITDFGTAVNTAITNTVNTAFVNALNVDADTLDGIDSASFLRSDQDDTINGSLTVTGDLTISGNTTSVNTTNLDVDDAIITLNNGQATPLNDIGFLLQRYATANSINYNVGVVWDESTGTLVFGETSEDGNDNAITFNTQWATISPTNGGQINTQRTTANFYLLGNHSAFHTTYGLNLASNKGVGWNDQTNSWSTAPDTILVRDAANTLALRNSTNAQTFNLYNTYTDASNYERGTFKWDTNVLKIGTEALGTGSARNISLIGGNVGVGTDTPAVSLDISATDAVQMPSGNTAQRPTGSAGMMRFNIDNVAFEGFDGTAWGGFAGPLNNLTDVTITSPASGQLIVYNGITSQWENSGDVSFNNIGLNQNGSFSIVADNGLGLVQLQGPASVPDFLQVFKIPGDDGVSGDVLTTDGSGNLSFTTPAGLTEDDENRFIAYATALGGW